MKWSWQTRRGDLAARVASALVRPDDVVVDAGAGWGLYAWLLARLVGAHGRVHAIDPVPDNAGSLARLARSYPQIAVHPVAVSDRHGAGTLHVPVINGDRYPALGSLKPPASRSGLAFETITVPLTTIDNLLGEVKVGFIKCDVEGHELRVLRGARHILRSSRPALLVEIEQRHQDADVTETFAYLRDMGYVGYALRIHGLTPLEEFDVRHDQTDWVEGEAFPGSVPAGYVSEFLFVQPEADTSGLPMPG